MKGRQELNFQRDQRENGEVECLITLSFAKVTKELGLNMWGKGGEQRQRLRGGEQPAESLRGTNRVALSLEGRVLQLLA